MMPYTEQDIQDYLDGSFKGDVKAFEDYIEQNGSARQLLQYYRMLYNNLNEEEMSLPFSLQEALVEKVLHKKPQLFYINRLVNLVLALTALAGIIFCWKIFGMNSLFENFQPVYLLTILLLCVFILAWHSIEWTARKKRYRLFLE